MATRTQDYEGVAAGAVPGSGNTVANGSTAVSTTITAGTGAASIVGTTTAGEVIDGSTSAKVSATGTAQAINSQNTGGGTQSGLSTRRRWLAAPTVNINEQVIRNTGGRSLSISLLTNGKVKISTNSADLYTTPAALTFPGVYRITGCVDTGTSANNDGKVQFAVYDSTETLAGGMTAPVEFTGLANVGAGAATSAAQWGKTDTGALTSAWTEIMDTVISTDTYALPGAPVVSAPPTVTGPSTISVTGTTASITFTATDTTGTVSSFACVHQSNTAASTVTPTVGSPTLTGIGTGSATATFPITGLTANARYFFGGTATDSTGATSTTPVIARVDVTSTAPALRPGTTTTGYTIVGGGTATQALSAGTPNTRNLQSAAPAAGSTGSATFEPLPPGAVPVAFSVTGHATDSTTALTRTVRLYQGTTLIATQTGTINPTTDTTIGRNTNTSETAAITDRSGLRVDWVVS